MTPTTVRDPAALLAWIPAPTTEAQRLTRAARLIDRHGWTQGMMQGPTGALCAIGAYHAVLSAQVQSPRSGYGIGALAIHLGVESVADWNDMTDRTQAEVTGALRATASALREVARRAG